MTRKDFVAIARVIEELRLNPDFDAKYGAKVTREFGWLCAQTNPNFDRARFERACEPSRDV